MTSRLGFPTFKEYSFAGYDEIYAEAMGAGTAIYSGAYIMPSGSRTFGYREKHRNHLKLLESMMKDHLADQISEAPSMERAFDLLRSYPGLGNFLSYQLITDLNYSSMCGYSEMDFTSPGPGALDGIHKCFSDLGGLSESDIIRWVADRQEREFERRGIVFRTLFGRPLQLIDCQNLFCEVSKYSRIRHPEIRGTNNRTRIKQVYRPANKPIAFWYPPKWGINELVPPARTLF